MSDQSRRRRATAPGTRLTRALATVPSSRSRSNPRFRSGPWPSWQRWPPRSAPERSNRFIGAYGLLAADFPQREIQLHSRSADSGGDPNAGMGARQHHRRDLLAGPRPPARSPGSAAAHTRRARAAPACPATHRRARRGPGRGRWSPLGAGKNLVVETTLRCGGQS